MSVSTQNAGEGSDNSFIKYTDSVSLLIDSDEADIAGGDFFSKDFSCKSPQNPNGEKTGGECEPKLAGTFSPSTFQFPTQNTDSSQQASLLTEIQNSSLIAGHQAEIVLLFASDVDFSANVIDCKKRTLESRLDKVTSRIYVLTFRPQSFGSVAAAFTMSEGTAYICRWNVLPNFPVRKSSEKCREDSLLFMSAARDSSGCLYLSNPKDCTINKYTPDGQLGCKLAVANDCAPLCLSVTEDEEPEIAVVTSTSMRWSLYAAMLSCKDWDWDNIEWDKIEECMQELMKKLNVSSVEEILNCEPNDDMDASDITHLRILLRVAEVMGNKIPSVSHFGETSEQDAAMIKSCIAFHEKFSFHYASSKNCCIWKGCFDKDRYTKGDVRVSQLDLATLGDYTVNDVLFSSIDPGEGMLSEVGYFQDNEALRTSTPIKDSAADSFNLASPSCDDSSSGCAGGSAETDVSSNVQSTSSSSSENSDDKYVSAGSESGEITGRACNKTEDDASLERNAEEILEQMLQEDISCEGSEHNGYKKTANKSANANTSGNGGEADDEDESGSSADGDVSCDGDYCSVSSGRHNNQQSAGQDLTTKIEVDSADDLTNDSVGGVFGSSDRSTDGVDDEYSEIVGERIQILTANGKLIEELVHNDAIFYCVMNKEQLFWTGHDSAFLYDRASQIKRKITLRTPDGVVAPNGICFGYDGDIIVSDDTSPNVMIFDGAFKFKRKLACDDFVSCVAFDGDDRIFCLCSGVIKVFSYNGVYLYDIACIDEEGRPFECGLSFTIMTDKEILLPAVPSGLFVYKYV